MRRISFGKRVQRWRASDTGAATALVAASMIIFMGAAALTVDLGNGWRTRRALIPATDAGALAPRKTT